jgi:hypothetical protein
MELLQPPDRSCVSIIESLPVLLLLLFREVPDSLVSHGPVPVKALPGRLER